MLSSRAVKYPMIPHPSYKVGFAVSLLIMAFQPILCTPLYVAAEEEVGVCYMNYKSLSPLSEELYELSIDDDLEEIHSDVWNEAVIMIPNTLIGYFLPLYLNGLFYHKATKAMNASLNELAAKEGHAKTNTQGTTAEPKTRGTKNKKGKAEESRAKPSRAVLQRQKENKAVAKLMMCISVLTCFIYLPMMAFDWVVILSPTFVHKNMNSVTHALYVMNYLLIVHSSVSPLFYAGMHREVKGAVKKLICRCNQNQTTR